MTNAPTYQMHGVAISAMTPFTKRDQDITVHREDTQFKFEMDLVNKDHNIVMSHILLMDRDVFHAFVNRMVYVAHDQGLEITQFEEE